LVVKALRRHCTLPFDVHLMISPVDAYLEAFATAGADHITVHVEAGPNLHRSLQQIASLGKMAGVAINPATPLDHVATVLDMVGLINVMTVNPGFGGQSFLASQLPRVAALRRMIDDAGRNVRLQVDGGIDHATARAVIEAGADVLVAGTSVYGATDYAAAIARLRPPDQNTPA
jgi:ribulose-phosphate 3-epimerase